MMKTLIYTCVITIGLFSVSCKKKAADVSSDYVGYWIAYDSYNGGSLLIDGDSKAVYETSNGAATTTVRGKARVKGNTLKIVVKKFTIDQKQTKDTTNMFEYSMVLDGVKYVKY